MHRMIYSLRLMKSVLLMLVAGFALLVAFNNIFDYKANFMFVQHVLSMDTTFKGNQLMWRAITVPWLHHMAYWLIISTEFLTGTLCVIGASQMFATRRGSINEFLAAKLYGVLGLVCGITLWFGGFIVVGAEWFVMWQSESWNGQQAAFRFTVCLFLCLLFVLQPEPEV